MPTYEYLCLQCKNKFDVRASLAEKKKGLKLKCPNCQSKKVVQVFGSFAVGDGSKEGRFMPGCGPNSSPGCCG